MGAKLFYDAALRLEPYNFPALMNSVDIYSRTNRLQAASVYALRATIAKPNSQAAWNYYGNILCRLEKYVEARKALQVALSLGSDHVATWHNFLLLNLRESKTQDALECYNHIVSLGGDNLTIQNDVAHAYLSLSELENAYPFYEARWASLQHLEPWDLHIPEWTGEHLLGKRILIHAEQGYGDTIMVARFIKNLLTYGAIVTFAVPPALVRLFEMQDWSENFEVINIHKIDETWSAKFDFHSPLYSMMRWLKIRREDISSKPFLSAPDLMTQNLNPEVFNVGICWASGSRGNEMDWRRRVSSLSLWLSLGEIPGIHLYSLFPGGEAQNEIISLGAESLVIDHVTGFEDFAETAAFIQGLDLVISVDTAIVHLAGALGKPVWMLSQFTPCWRWWNLNLCSGLPWYDGMKIYPQAKPGDWPGQLEACKKDLQKLAEKKLALSRSLAA